MNDGVRKFKFIGKDEPDTVIGERVVMRLALPIPALGPQRNLSVHSFCKHVEKNIVEAMKTYGRDCDNFELTVDEEGRVGLIFTRPMDRLELTHFRTVVQKSAPAASEDPTAARAIERSLPDPATVVHRGAVASLQFAG